MLSRPLTVLSRSQNQSELNQQDTEGRTKLHRAVTVGDVVTLKKLIAARADVNCKDKNGDTPLILAAANNNANFVKLLVDAKADVKLRNRQRMTAQIAARLADKQNDFITEDHLRAAGAENLHIAVLDHDLAKIKKLAKKAGVAELNRFYTRKEEKDDMRLAPPLHIAAYTLDYEIAKFLLAKKGIDSNSQDQYGQTALESCIYEADFKKLNFRKVFDLLYKNTAIQHGMTALHFACYANKLEIVEMLVKEYQEDILATNAWGQTPLDLARGKIKEFLLARLEKSKLPELVHHRHTSRRNSWYECLGEEYEKIKLLGAGSSGSVFLTEKKTTNTEHKLPTKLAVKTFNSDVSPMPLKDMREEAECNQAIHGFSAFGDKCFAMPVIEGRDLTHFKTVRIENALAICIALIDAVIKLHTQHKRIHEDINFGSFLIKEVSPNKYEADLIDFGLTTRTSHITKKYYAGHDGYFAPELKIPGPANPVHDIYALGRVFKEYFVNFEKSLLIYKPQFDSLFYKMMAKPSLRPSLAEVREFFNNEINLLAKSSIPLTPSSRIGLFPTASVSRKIDKTKTVSQYKQPWRGL